MLRSNIAFFSLFLLSINPINTSATETLDTESLEDSSLIIEQVLEPIESPLVTDDEEHGRLHVSAIDSEHHLFPVRITFIDGWHVNENIFEKELRLKAGEHQLKIVPDFSNIEHQLLFMSRSWQEKHISFTLQNDHDIVVSARLTDYKELKWDVQVYRVVIPSSRLDALIDTQFSN